MRGATHRHQAIAPRAGLAGFAAAARAADSLPALCAAFADAIAAEGFGAHCCLRTSPDAAPDILFGDGGAVSIAARSLLDKSHEYPVSFAADGRHHLLVPVECWQADALFVLITGRAAAPDRAAIARVHGLAEVHATYGYSLFERQQDIATSAGLGLVQRRCLALVLTGHRDVDIARLLDLTPLAVEGHLAQAMILLDADIRAQAVAIAARRGWLVGLDQSHVTQL